MPDEFQALKKERCVEIIKACNGSGLPKRQWCREHGISYSTFMRWQRSLRNELAGEIMVAQAVVPLQIEPQASRCSPVQEVTIQKDGIALEKKFSKMSDVIRKTARQVEAEPLLEAYWWWLDTLDPVPGSKLADAVTSAPIGPCFTCQLRIILPTSFPSTAKLRSVPFTTAAK